MYKFKCNDRSYGDTGFIDAKLLSDKLLTLDINPLEHKLFNQDIFDYDGKTFKLLHSTIRCSNNMPGVLILEGNKTYGKIRNKLLYKCIPDDKRLPTFLVRYKIKYKFNKNISNKYIIFKFKNWNDKHPLGEIVNTIGDIGLLDNFYEYQLFCKSLYASIQNFNKAVMKALRVKTSDEYIEQIILKYKLIDRRDKYIITIDPMNSRDFDDAIGIIDNDDSIILSIYISNVTLWMDALGLWESFSNRIATIYLPDRKRPMLPTVLSDNICSLRENEDRFAFTLDIYIKDNKIMDYKFINSVIRVRKNLRYDTIEQKNDIMYKKINNIVDILNKGYKYIDKIHTSHEVVAYLMVLMNNYSAKELIKYKTGIYRSAKLNDNYIPDEDLKPEIKKFLKIWNSFGGRYCKYNDMEGHDLLKLESYVHISSPIRRLVDLLTMMILQDKLSLFNLTNKSQTFYNKWSSNDSIEYINKTMRSIRKVQNDCKLLDLVVNNKEKYIDRDYEGYVFDKIKRNDGLFQYMIYVCEINLTKRFTTRNDIPNNSYVNCKLYIFIDEVKYKNKIMVEII